MSPFTFCLSNGMRIVVRGIQPGDKKHIIQGLDALSSQSLFYRFNTSHPRIDERQLDYLTRVDQVDHVALCVMCSSGTDYGLGIGVGRYIRRTEEPHVAEIAITILDAYQRMGIGALLMVGLSKIAYKQDVTHFSMQVHASRYTLTRKLVESGAETESVSGGISELILPVEHFIGVAKAQDEFLNQAYELFDTNWA